MAWHFPRSRLHIRKLRKARKLGNDEHLVGWSPRAFAGSSWLWSWSWDWRLYGTRCRSFHGENLGVLIFHRFIDQIHLLLTALYIWLTDLPHLSPEIVAKDSRSSFCNAFFCFKFLFSSFFFFFATLHFPDGLREVWPDGNGNPPEAVLQSVRRCGLGQADSLCVRRCWHDVSTGQNGGKVCVYQRPGCTPSMLQFLTFRSSSNFCLGVGGGSRVFDDKRRQRRRQGLALTAARLKNHKWATSNGSCALISTLTLSDGHRWQTRTEKRVFNWINHKMLWDCTMTAIFVQTVELYALCRLSRDCKRSLVTCTRTRTCVSQAHTRTQVQRATCNTCSSKLRLWASSASHSTPW